MSQPQTRPSRQTSEIVSAYLSAYNVVQFLGWSALLFTTVYHMLNEGTILGLYDHTSSLVKIIQTAALLEVVHAALGMVRSSPLVTGVQVMSRVYVIWGILHPVADSRDTVGYLMLLVAWSLTETIRYPFYVCQMVGQVPYALKWARYSFFILLYPIGVSGELLTIYNAMPHVRTTGLYSLTLPNNLNIAFNYHYYLIFVSLLYIPFFPQLYLYMLNQRKKVISSPAPKSD